MKRSVIPAACLPFLLLAGADVSAQTRIALTGGVSLTSAEERLELGVSSAGESVPRPSIGLSAIVPLPWSLALELGGAYSERGRELVYGWCGTFPRLGASVSMEYLEFKALGRVNLPLAENRVLAFVTVGPTMAWELSCRSSPTVTSGQLPPDDSGSRSCGGVAELALDDLDFVLALADLQLGLGLPEVLLNLLYCEQTIFQGRHALGIVEFEDQVAARGEGAHWRQLRDLGLGADIGRRQGQRAHSTQFAPQVGLHYQVAPLHFGKCEALFVLGEALLHKVSAGRECPGREYDRNPQQ